jgi:hypothetical protein
MKCDITVTVPEHSLLVSPTYEVSHLESFHDDGGHFFHEDFNLSRAEAVSLLQSPCVSQQSVNALHRGQKTTTRQKAPPGKE